MKVPNYFFRSNSADSSLTGDVLGSSRADSPFHHQHGGNMAPPFTSTLRNRPGSRQELSHRTVELGAAEELNIGGELRFHLFNTSFEFRGFSH
jgi:hypothetical protein